MASSSTADSTSSKSIGLRDEKSGAGSRIPKIWNASSIPMPLKNKAEGVHKKLPGKDVGRQSTVLVRKKLPWLDGNEQSKPGDIPGSYPSRDSLQVSDAQESPPPVPEKDHPPVQNDRTSATSLYGDPALRAIGSTPSLRTRTKTGDVPPSGTFSLNSQPRSGVKPLVSKSSVKKPLGAIAEPAPVQGYSSSEYSTAPSTSKDELPPNLPKKDPSSYERLVDRKNVPTETRRNTLQSGPTQLRQNDGEQGLDADISPLETAGPSRRGRRRESRQSRSSNPRIKDMPKAKTLPRRTFVEPIPDPQEPDFPPPGPPARKSTLFAMPTHLLPSSSSSSYSPQQSSTSPVIVPLSVPSSPTRTATMPIQRSNSLHRAVTGLGNLMEEAISVAQEAAKRGRNDEVANILDNATIALRHASVAQNRMAAGRMSSPLVLDPQPQAGRHEHSDSESSIAPDSDVSSTHSRTQTMDTAPTLLTKSAQSSRQPIAVSQTKPSGCASVASPTIRQNPRDVPPRRHSTDSISRTPPRLYQPPSADSIVRDFAYAREKTAKAEAARGLSRQYGAASGYYHDHGESVKAQPGVRPSVSAPMITDAPLSELPGRRRLSICCHPRRRRKNFPIHYLEPVVIDGDDSAPVPPPRKSSHNIQTTCGIEEPTRRKRAKTQPVQEAPEMVEASKGYYHSRPPANLRALAPVPAPARTATTTTLKRNDSGFVTDHRYGTPNFPPPHNGRASVSKSENPRYSGGPPTLLSRDMSLRHPRRKHVSLREGQGFSLGRYHRRQPIAREWNTHRKRITATIACLNTVFIGLITGIYAGEVPRIQYALGDSTHKVILGNVVFFATLGATTLIFWPLPLLHGRKPYMLLGFGLLLPLMFPQAMVVSGYRNPNNPIYRVGLLLPRSLEGIAMGFANINFLPILFDLFGASLMSANPHQEVVVYDDVRRQGSGIGLWLGIWSFCFVGSMSIGFCVGALIISSLSPAWGFYIIVIMLAFFLLVNVIAPETRRAPYRRSIAQYVDGEGEEEKIKRRVARGEVKLHISNDGPKWWWEEVWAGVVLTTRMIFQAGFFIMMLYLGWMFAQVTLVVLLLGALLTRDYHWQPQWVGPAVLSIAFGALLAVPLSKANLFSRARDTPQRTDSMTMKHTRVHWSSHMLRRCLFTLTLPFAALAYTLSSAGESINAGAPIIFCGLVGFLSNLAIAECVGIIMETYDTCDLQPGVNQKHRLQSMAETVRRRRTNYSSFPRICAGFFAAQSLGFFLSAAATAVSGDVTRAVGAQTATAIVASIVLALTCLFIIVLWRWREVQVIPNHIFGSTFGKSTTTFGGPGVEDPEWKPVIIGNPSGKLRRMSLLELGDLTRWTEIRKLNKLYR